MRDIEKLFKKEFVIRIEGVGYSTRVIDSKEIKCQIVPIENNELPAKEFNGYLGQYYFLGTKAKTVEYPSFGKLAAVQVYTPEDDDMVCAEFAIQKGYALIDCNGKVAYVNTVTTSRIFADKYDVTSILYKYGPSALAFAEASDFENREVGRLVNETFNERIAALTKKGVAQETLDAEVDLFKNVVSSLKEASLESQDAEMLY